MSGSQLLVRLGDIRSRGVKRIQRETGRVSDKRKVNGSIESRVRRVQIFSKILIAILIFPIVQHYIASLYSNCETLSKRCVLPLTSI